MVGASGAVDNNGGGPAELDPGGGVAKKTMPGMAEIGPGDKDLVELGGRSLLEMGTAMGFGTGTGPAELGPTGEKSVAEMDAAAGHWYPHRHAAELAVESPRGHVA